MSAKRNTAQKAAADIALVVFGTKGRQSHASRFGIAAAQSAQDAARAMGMATLRIASPAQLAIARRLPKGTVSAKGRTLVPVVAPALYHRLLAIAGTDAVPPTPSSQPPAEGSKKPSSPTELKSGKSDGRDGLIRGSVCLATDNELEGYFVCVVQHVDGDTVSLVWRDFADLGKFSRKLSQVALLHSGSGVKPVGR